MKLSYFIQVLSNCFIITGLFQCVQGVVHLKYYEANQLTIERSEAQSGSYVNLGTYPHWCLGNLDKCSDGLTIDLWLKTVKVAENSADLVLFSTGGNAYFSNGAYLVQRYGDQYEFGVAKGKDLWRQTFRIYAEMWVHVTATWNVTSGLNIYVDGSSATTSNPEVRKYTENEFDAFPEVVLGIRSDGSYVMDKSLFDINRIHIYDSVKDVSDLEEVKDLIYLGCVPASTVGQYIKTVDLKDPTTAITTCRRYCSANHSIARVQSNSVCNCAESTAGVTKGPDVCGVKDAWKVYRSSGVRRDSPFTVNVMVKKLQTRNYVKPLETVLIELTPNFDVPVVYEIDFGDSSNMKTSKHSFNHFWKKEGSYIISVKVNIGLLSVTNTTTFAIDNVDEGVAPEFVRLSEYHDQSLPMTGHFEFLVADPAVANCLLDFNDKTKKFDTGSITSYYRQHRLQHVFPESGEFHVSSSCENPYGVRNSSVYFLSTNAEDRFLYLEEGKNFSLFLFGRSSFISGVDVVRNLDNHLNVVSSGQTVTVPASELQPFENYISFKSNNEFIFNRILFVENVPQRATIKPEFREGEWNVTTNIVVEVPQGNNIFIACDFGNGEEEQFFIYEANCTVKLAFEVEYSSLGYYPIKVVVSNDMGKTEVNDLISVEVPIQSIAITTQNITDLMTPVQLTIDLNADEDGPDKVNFEINHDDGNVLLYPYRSRTKIFTPYVNEYIYKDWGIYNICVTAFNSVTNVSTCVIVQVGENITYVDLKTNEGRSTTSSFAEIVLNYLSGTDITYTFDFGDNSLFIFTDRDLSKTNTTMTGGDSAVTTTVYPSTSMLIQKFSSEDTTTVSNSMETSSEFTKLTSSSMNITTVESTTQMKSLPQINRRRRSAVESSPKSIAERQSAKFILVKHMYKTQGYFTVRVGIKNVFSSASFTMCPPIIVNNADTVNCNAPLIAVPYVKSSRENPAVRVRSDQIDLEVVYQSKCPSVKQNRYSWRTYEIFDNRETPVDSLCKMEIDENVYTIPPVTFPYGKYKLTVTVAPMGFPTKAAQAVVFLDIKPSNPVAEFIGDTEISRFSDGPLLLDFHTSRDPDLIKKNKVGLEFDIVFFRKTDYDEQINRLNLQEYLEGNNTDTVKEDVIYESSTRNSLRVYNFNDALKEETSLSQEIEVADGSITLDTKLFAVSQIVVVLVVSKEGRMSQTRKEVKMVYGDLNKAIDILNDALNLNDTGKALDIVDTIGSSTGSESNDTEANEKMNEVNELVLTVVDNVADKATDPSMVKRVADTVGKFTQNSDTVNDNAREKGASAVIKTGNLTTQKFADQDNDELEGTLAGQVGAFSNILPKEKPPDDDDEEEEDDDDGTAAAPRAGDVLFTVTDSGITVPGQTYQHSEQMSTQGYTTDSQSAQVTIPAHATNKVGQKTTSRSFESTAPSYVTTTKGKATTTTPRIAPNAATTTTSATTPTTTTMGQRIVTTTTGQIILTIRTENDAVTPPTGQKQTTLMGQTPFVPGHFNNYSDQWVPTTVASQVDNTVWTTGGSWPENVTWPFVSQSESDNHLSEQVTVRSTAGVQSTVSTKPDYITTTPTTGASTTVYLTTTMATTTTTKPPAFAAKLLVYPKYKTFIKEQNLISTAMLKTFYKYLFKHYTEFRRAVKSRIDPKKFPTNVLYEDQITLFRRVGLEWDPFDIEKVINKYVAKEVEISRLRALDADKNVAAATMDTMKNMGGLVVGNMESARKCRRRRDAGEQVSCPKTKPSMAIKTENVEVEFGNDDKAEGGVTSAGGCGVGKRAIKNKNNPFTFAKNADQINSEVKSLDYSDPCANKDIVVKNLTEPIEMRIPVKGIVPLFNATLRGRSFIYHSVNVTRNQSSLHLMLWDPEENVTKTTFYVCLQKVNLTTPDPCLYSTLIPHPSSAFGHVTEPELRWKLTHTFFPPQNVTNTTGMYLFKVRIESSLFTYAKETVVEYNYKQWVTGCFFMDKKTESFASDGVFVSNLTTPNETVCLSTHLTSFGGDFAVPPNTIDFTNVWAKFNNLGDNPAVFATVIGLIGLYIICLIWARHMDKKDIAKWGASPLDDNLPSDNYHYQLTVQTGMRKKSGTTSKISFILSGEECDTGVRQLYDGHTKEIPRGSLKNYILSVESPLGPLSFMRIWHDNTGKGKLRSWYLDQVQVTDLQTGERYFFLCNRWLAVEEDDGMVDRILPVAGLEDLAAFKQLFSSSVKKKITNEHLWFSVFSRPTRSNFTRVQRISCCMSLLFMTMITNAMWFKSEEKQTNTTALKMGPFSFTLQQVFISFASTVIVFPANFIIITFFRKCRPKKNAILQSNQQLPKRGKWKSVAASSQMWSKVPTKSRWQKFKDSCRECFSFRQRSKYADDPDPEDTVPEMKIAGIPDDPKKKNKRKRKAGSLPHWCIYIAYVLCFFCIVTSGFFTILYSMQWGAEKANEWLTTFVMSFVQSVIVVQPIKVLCLVAFIACVLKKPELEEEDSGEDLNNVIAAHDEEFTKKDNKTIDEIAMKRKMANSDFKPPDMEALNEARETRMKELKMEEVVKEIVVYAFFVIVLFFLSYQARDSESFLFAENLKGYFETGFDKIQTVDGYWNWLEQKLIPALYATKYPNGTQVRAWWDKRCIADLEARRVGLPRLRQLRVKNDTCDINPRLSAIIHHCRDEYGWIDDDTKPYLPQWAKIPEENITEMKDKKTPWIYQNSVDLKNAPYVATISTYKGGGYVSLFERNETWTYQVVNELKENNWLDVNTRGVFLEFAVYNPNVNLFGSAIMLVEFMSTGGATVRSEIKVFRLLSYIGGFGVLVILFEVIYACFTLYFFIRCINKVRKERLKYFSGFWNILEFVLLCFCVAVIAFYALKQILTVVTMNALKDPYKADYVNFQSMAIYDEMFGYMIGCVVFLATIQFLKLLQFNKKMNMLGDTIKLATKDLKVFSVAFCLYFFAFTACAYLLFGPVISSYNGMITSAESMFAFTLGSFDFAAMAGANKVLGPLFFFTFVGVVYVGLMSMFFTIIGDAFSEVKENVESRSNDYEIVDFMWRRLKGIMGLT